MWEDIKDFPNYQITSAGHVWSKNHNKFLIPNIVRSGYKMVRLSADGWSKDFLIHRIVADHFVNNPNNKPIVNHKDGDKLNNYWLNLEYVTDSENQLHALSLGLKRPKRGETHHNSKVTSDDVRQIRYLYDQGETVKEIGKKYNLHFATIHRIVTRQTWKDI